MAPWTCKCAHLCVSEVLDAGHPNAVVVGVHACHHRLACLLDLLALHLIGKHKAGLHTAHLIAVFVRNALSCHCQPLAAPALCFLQRHALLLGEEVVNVNLAHATPRVLFRVANAII